MDVIIRKAQESDQAVVEEFYKNEAVLNRFSAERDVRRAGGVNGANLVAVRFLAKFIPSTDNDVWVHNLKQIWFATDRHTVLPACDATVDGIKNRPRQKTKTVENSNLGEHES